MSLDLLDQLARSEVPAPPPELEQGVHERLNATLVTLQVMEALLRALPYAALQFARSVLGLLVFTLTGRYPPSEKTSRTSEIG